MKKLFLIISFLLLTGCSDYTEINDLAIVTGIIIDYKDSMFEVTTELIINEKESEVKVFKTMSTSIEESLAEISKLCNKELFMSDLKVLLLTNNILENDINTFDSFLRNSKLKMNFAVYIIDSNIASEIFTLNKENDGSSLYVEELMTFNEKVFSSSTKIDYIDLVKYTLEYGINPLYPTIEIKESEDNKSLYLSDLVSYNSELKKIELNEIESIIYNIIVNESKNTIIDINCNEHLFTIELEEIESMFSFKKNTLNIDIEASSKLKTYNCEYELDDEKTIDILSKLSKEYIDDEANKLVIKAKENYNDFFGFGNYLYKHKLNNFDYENKNWDKEFPNLNVSINTKIKIVATGEARKDIGDNHGKNK